MVDTPERLEMRTSPRILLPEKEPKPELPTVLFVEDKADLSHLVIDSLSEFFNMIAAKNGKEALGKLKNSIRPDVIVSDIMMDELNGYEFYDSLASDPAYKIFLSSF